MRALNVLNSLPVAGATSVDCSCTSRVFRRDATFGNTKCRFRLRIRHRAVLALLIAPKPGERNRYVSVAPPWERAIIIVSRRDALARAAEPANVLLRNPCRSGAC
jgi:hypothetical protein